MRSGTAARDFPDSEDAKDLYLTLLKHALTYYLWGETLAPIETMPRTSPLRKSLYWIVKAADGLISSGSGGRVRLAYRFRFDPEKRIEGADWPPLADTMIGLRRLNNIQSCIEEILRRNVPGDLIETGVWRGDSFQGLPPPDTDQYPSDAGDPHHRLSYFLGVSLEAVKRNFKRYGLLDDQVRFLEGWFKDTLPGAPIERLALLRLDGDMYESTMDALSSLYPKLSAGGYVIVDDYYLEGCKQAVHDYRQQHDIGDEIHRVGEYSAYWQRSRPPA